MTDSMWPEDLLTPEFLGLTELLRWARANTEITYYEPTSTLVCGKFSDRKFRMFLDEGWAGVIQEGDAWTESVECRTLDDFKKALDYDFEIARAVVEKLSDEERIELFNLNLLGWAVGRWQNEVQNRPLQNIYRHTLDCTWRQVIRFAGGDPDKLVGPMAKKAPNG